MSRHIFFDLLWRNFRRCNVLAVLFFVYIVPIRFALLTTAVENKDPLSDYFSLITKKEKNVFAASVVSIGGKDMCIDSSRTALFGKQSVLVTERPMTVSTSFRTNTLSEFFLDIVVAKLELLGELPFSRKAAIPSEFLPPPYDKGTPFVNPLYIGLAITLDNLLLHISSLSGEGFETGAVKTPGPTETLEKFLTDLFSTSHKDLWSDKMPGLASSYYYSRINTALVTYIIDKVLAKSSKPVSLATFIQKEIIASLGLTGTFLLDKTGLPPVSSYPPGDVPSLSGRSVQDITEDGSKVLSSFTIHAAYASDYMYYTSTQDLAKLTFELFLGGSLTLVGDLLRETTISFNKGSILPPGVISRSLGVYNFDPKKLCKEIDSCSNGCWLDKKDEIFGWVVEASHNQVAFLCTNDDCVAAEVSYYTNTTLHCSFALGFVTLSLTQKEHSDFFWLGSLYPLYIFLGVFNTIVVVIGASYITDYFVQPAKGTNIINADNTATAMQPINEIENINNSSLLQTTRERTVIKGVSPPLKHLDIYD